MFDPLEGVKHRAITRCGVWVLAAAALYGYHGGVTLGG